MMARPFLAMPTMILVQISDTHISHPGDLVYGEFDTSSALTHAIDAINAMDPLPDLVLHTGDIASHGSPERYRHFRDIMSALEAPWVMIPGNHDSRDALVEVFRSGPELPAGGTFLHFTVDEYPVRLICCDSTIPGETPGELCSERIAWLEERLAESEDKPTIVALHHPPFYSGLTGSSAKGLLRGGPELVRTIRRFPNVIRVLAGHIHRPITMGFAGTVAFTGPTTCYPFELSMSKERLLNISYEPPSFAVHLWLPDAGPEGPGLVSHVVPFGDWPAARTLLRGGKRVQ